MRLESSKDMGDPRDISWRSGTMELSGAERRERDRESAAAGVADFTLIARHVVVWLASEAPQPTTQDCVMSWIENGQKIPSYILQPCASVRTFIIFMLFEVEKALILKVMLVERQLRLTTFPALLTQWSSSSSWKWSGTRGASRNERWKPNCTEVWKREETQAGRLVTIFNQTAQYFLLPICLPCRHR